MAFSTTGYNPFPQHTRMKQTDYTSGHEAKRNDWRFESIVAEPRRKPDLLSQRRKWKSDLSKNRILKTSHALAKRKQKNTKL